MTPQKLRTAIYARVSTLDQDPAMQLRELRAYVAHRRLPIAAEFIDQVSGTTADRPALARLRIIQEMQRRRRAGQSLHQIAKQLGISHQTVANDGSPRNARVKRR